jgi:hypothetical protein
MAACKRCNAPMRWVKTLSGKNMPLDVDPVEPGNGTFTVIETTDPESGRPVETAYSYKSAKWQKWDPAEISEADWFTSHFATCPYADEFRGRK